MEISRSSILWGHDHALKYIIILPIVHGHVLYVPSAACCSAHEGLWELSDNMASYEEKLPILDAVAMGTGVVGMHVWFVYSAAPCYTKIGNAIML